MFDAPKPKTPARAAPGSLRDTLFGDLPLDAWAHGEESALPWAHFVRVGRFLEEGNIAAAVATLHGILFTPELESRHYLQAWHQLRQLGMPPKGEARQLLGVVVEVALEGGLDILAAYADLSARYINYSGAAIVWDSPDNSLDEEIGHLLQASAPILDQIGPWESARPPAPPPGQMRINLLAPGGLFFGQAPIPTLLADPLAAPAVNAATRLMQALIAKSASAR